MKNKKNKSEVATEQRLVPELRFPSFTDEWFHESLKSITEINPSSIELPEEFIYIDLESVEQGRLVKKEKIKINEAPSRAQRLLSEDDILYQTVRPYQRNNFHFHENGNYVASTGYAQLRTFKSSGFLYQYLHTDKFVNKVLVRCTGTSYPAINSKELSKIKVSFPTLPEQQKIAAFLTAVDKRIELLEKKKALLEQYKKGVMQKIFSQEIRFKKEDGSDFEDWEEKKLGEVLDYFDGTHQTPKYVEKGIPFYSVEHISNDQFEETKFISEEVFDKENRRVKLERGDILMTRIGSIGVARLIDWEVKASFYVSLALIKKSNEVDSRFLSHFINGENFQKELWRRTIHVAFPKKINLGEIGECVISLPTFREQQLIGNYLESIHSQIKAYKVLLEKTQAFKKGLLQKMFV